MFKIGDLICNEKGIIAEVIQVHRGIIKSLKGTKGFVDGYTVLPNSLPGKWTTYKVWRSEEVRSAS